MISVKNIYKTFGNKKTGELSVLRGISCDIKRGERVVIIGPSGSGKSTVILNASETSLLAISLVSIWISAGTISD